MAKEDPKIAGPMMIYAPWVRDGREASAEEQRFASGVSGFTVPRNSEDEKPTAYRHEKAEDFGKPLRVAAEHSEAAKRMGWIVAP